MQKHLNAIRTVVLICFAGKAVSVRFAGAEDGLDIYHFGWNIARRLKISNDDMALFLKSQFVWHLDDSALSTISKKLSYEIGKSTIPKVNPKDPLLPFPLAKEFGVC